MSAARRAIQPRPARTHRLDDAHVTGHSIAAGYACYSKVDGITTAFDIGHEQRALLAFTIIKTVALAVALGECGPRQLRPALSLPSYVVPWALYAQWWWCSGGCACSRRRTLNRANSSSPRASS